MKLKELRTDISRTEVGDIYTDWKYIFYPDYPTIFYRYFDFYHLRYLKEKLNEWKEKITVESCLWEDIPLNVQKRFRETNKGIQFPSSENKKEINNKNMNIKEKFVLALTVEPQKSFRKAEITNGDDILTEDGEKVFLSWLLHKKFSDEFKKEVVDELLKKEKKEEE